MKVDIRHKPSFATLFVTLMTGDSIVAESDAMASMSKDTGMRTRFNGGFFKALLKRFFGGESLFVNEFFCPEGVESVDVVITQPTPGDLQEMTMDGNVLFMQPGAYLASETGVTLGVSWAGFASWIGGEGLFRLKVGGKGRVFFGGYGGIFEKVVEGEYVVDSGHLLAYEPTVTLKMGLAGGLISSIFSGEGLVSRMKGQGKIYMQTRSLDGLAAWTNTYLR